MLDELPQLTPDVALVDLRMPDVGGLDMLRAIRDVHPSCQVILMTAHVTMDSAIEAVKLGALDYMAKPFEIERLRSVLDTVRYGIARRERLMTADNELASQFEFNGLIGGALPCRNSSTRSAASRRTCGPRSSPAKRARARSWSRELCTSSAVGGNADS
jgi:DNA-binding NtrC family response regulator